MNQKGFLKLKPGTKIITTKKIIVMDGNIPKNTVGTIIDKSGLNDCLIVNSPKVDYFSVYHYEAEPYHD